jgi:hypothetical protein
MPEDFYMRVIKDQAPYLKGNVNQVYTSAFRLREKDIQTGQKLPDLSVSIYKLSDDSSSRIAQILLEHAAQMPLSSPDVNTVLLNVTPHMDNRTCLQTPVATPHFSYVSALHHELQFRDKDDLLFFLGQVIGQYSSHTRVATPAELRTYLQTVVQNRDLEWMHLIRHGLPNGKTLDESWLDYVDRSEYSLRRFLDDEFCGPALTDMKKAPLSVSSEITETPISVNSTSTEDAAS